MTDKQIIIDGLNVAGCEFAVKPINDNRIKCHCAKGLLQIAKMQEQPENIKSGLCENNPNCYYKQLKRKEQECEELKKTIDILLKIQYQLADSCNKYIQTLTEIKEIAEKEVKRAPDGETFARPEIKQILQKIRECEVKYEN